MLHFDIEKIAAVRHIAQFIYVELSSVAIAWLFMLVLLFLTIISMRSLEKFCYAVGVFVGVSGSSGRAGCRIIFF